MQAKQEMEAIKALSAKVAGLVETITNDNGTAIKFANGTMICTYRETVTDQAINNTYGSAGLYYGIRSWQFPVPFVENPVCSCGMFKYGTGASWGGINSVSSTNANLIGYDFFPRAAGTAVNISATAIGRWK